MKAKGREEGQEKIKGYEARRRRKMQREEGNKKEKDRVATFSLTKIGTFNYRRKEE